MDTINPPPYPKGSTSPSQLYALLTELYDWTEMHRDWANMRACELNAPDDPFVPELGPYPGEAPDRYLQLSVPDMFISWQAARAIREKYDQIVRNYDADDDSWNSDPATFHRINIVKSAAMLMSLCFLDTEKREAKTADMMKKQRKHFLRLLKDQLSEITGLFDGGHDDDEIDFDSLFHPPEED